MRQEQAGITRSQDGLDGITWNILGQIYVPKTVTEHSFAWHATFPPGTFVPPHSHPTQNEYLYILEGRLDFWLNGEETSAGAGDTVRLRMLRGGETREIEVGFEDSGRTRARGA